MGLAGAMNRALLERSALIALALLALVSFYVCARFTVDDAFITWRYGQNLVESGIWGYNATDFDLTQAYTNPLMAVLSIVPALLSMDVVLFFKLFSVACVLLPLGWLRRVTPSRLIVILYLALLVLPATMIHAFSGLETYLFVVLMGALLISLSHDDLRGALICTFFLLFTRPEAWLLIGLVPAYFFVGGWQQRDRSRMRKAVGMGVLLTLAFALYAAFHWHYFGYVLPNTFYIKSGGTFRPGLAAEFLFFLAPVGVLALSGRWRLLGFTLLFFLPVVYNYASSSLQMNYSERFAYHIFAPVYLLVAYMAATERKKLHLLAAITPLLAFAALTAHPMAMVDIANYYPRALDSHAALGKAIRTEGIRSFALSDAGMAAYHSRAQAFDNTGLGSALVAHKGPTREIIDQYHPELILLRADDAGVVLSSDNKKNLHQWALDHHYRPRCDIYWRAGYKLRVFSPNNVPALQTVCDASSVNNSSEWDYFVAYNTVPPWHFWHE